MLKERTLALIKPIAVRKHHTGDIISMIEKNGFDIVAIKKIHLKEQEARAFYSVHRERGFFNELVKFMSSGPIVAMVLEKVNAVEEYRELMGNTDPNEAKEGTIRNLFAESKQQNAVHGSDTIEHSNQEVRFFFSELEIVEL